MTDSGSQSGKVHITRRRFAKTFVGGVSAAALLWGWTRRVEPFWLEVSRLSLPLANLPSSLHGKTLLHLSDLHIGATDQSYLLSVIDQINELSPYLIVITGDFIDHAFPQATGSIRQIFSRLDTHSTPTFGCLGNHDYGRHWCQLDVADQVAGTLTDLGVRVLRDEMARIEGLDIFGIEDYWSPRFQSKPVLADANPGRPSLCLCHNPDVADKPVWEQFGGTILAGHTHGGQCKPPFFPPPRIPVRNKSYVSGFYSLDQNRQMYISRGAGYGLRARFNCRPQITLFTLNPA